MPTHNGVHPDLFAGLGARGTPPHLIAATQVPTDDGRWGTWPTSFFPSLRADASELAHRLYVGCVASAVRIAGTDRAPMMQAASGRHQDAPLAWAAAACELLPDRREFAV